MASAMPSSEVGAPHLSALMRQRRLSLLPALCLMTRLMSFASAQVPSLMTDARLVLPVC